MKNNMIKCENCLKNDVCGKMERVKDDLERLKLSAEFQKLENNNIYIVLFSIIIFVLLLLAFKYKSLILKKI